jgi:hypothetical protein
VSLRCQALATGVNRGASVEQRNTKPESKGLHRSGLRPHPGAVAAKSANPTSVFLYSSLSDAVKQQIAADQSGDAGHKALSSALAKYFNEQVAAPALYAPGRFDLKAIRPETDELLAKNPRGVELMRLNKLLIEDAYPAQLAKSVSEGWIVKDGAMASTGSGRGVIYSTRDYARFRLIFTMRHVSGKPDHQAGVLIFCTRPQPGEKPLDALGGIQFQVPNGGHWDYRPGMNQGGGTEFNNPQKPAFDIHSWSRVEILADASRGTARMAVAQPPGSKGIEVLNFHDPTAGKIGPIALQMHNAGLLDEYKDLVIEIDPADDELLSTRLPSGT